MTTAREQPAYLARRRAERSAVERRSRFKREFGITPEQYDVMLEDQGGVCAICGEPETLTDRHGTRRLAVDHDHESGRVRGLLCANCNNGLGRFKDSPILLAQALAYLDT